MVAPPLHPRIEAFLDRFTNEQQPAALEALLMIGVAVAEQHQQTTLSQLQHMASTPAPAPAHTDSTIRHLQGQLMAIQAQVASIAMGENTSKAVATSPTKPTLTRLLNVTQQSATGVVPNGKGIYPAWWGHREYRRQSLPVDTSAWTCPKKTVDEAIQTFEEDIDRYQLLEKRDQALRRMARRVPERSPSPVQFEVDEAPAKKVMTDAQVGTTTADRFPGVSSAGVQSAPSKAINHQQQHNRAPVTMSFPAPTRTNRFQRERTERHDASSVSDHNQSSMVSPPSMTTAASDDDGSIYNLLSAFAGDKEKDQDFITIARQFVRDDSFLQCLE